MAGPETTARNLRRFHRRCGWAPCGALLTYNYDEPLTSAPLRLYCKGTDCAARAAGQRLTLQRLLGNIERRLTLVPSRGEEAKQLKRWRRLALWELGEESAS